MDQTASIRDVCASNTDIIAQPRKDLQQGWRRGGIAPSLGDLARRCVNSIRHNGLRIPAQIPGRILRGERHSRGYAHGRKIVLLLSNLKP